MNITIIKPAEKTRSCGGAEMAVQWRVDGSSTGWIIQHVKFVKNRYNCSDNELPPIGFTGEYWEAWQVKNGKVYIGDTEYEHSTDTFRIADQGYYTKGKVVIKGKVKFFEGYHLQMPPWQKYIIPQAGLLPTMSTTPPGWDDMGAAEHSLTSEWNCCAEEPTNRVSGIPTQSEEEESGGEMKPVEEIIGLCPLWTELAAADKLQRSQVTKQLQRLQQYDLRTIRDGMASYIKKANYSSYTVKQMGQLFVLNRLLFAVPGEIPLGSIPFFGGWDVPVNGGMVNSCWPWSLNNRTENICLTGLFSGYSGDQFLALEEFDYLRDRFGRRHNDNLILKPSFRRTEDALVVTTEGGAWRTINILHSEP